MSVTNIKKMNVRSPYYVVVKGDEAAEVTPTETVITEETFVCGGTKSIGAFVGKKKYNISAIGRDNGDYTVSFSGVKFPIKYRIGLASNIDNISFTTKGLDTYATEWGNAGENTADLDAADSYPNGLTFDATYTSTGDDAIMLEVYHPLISTVDYSFSLSCPDITAIVTPTVGDFVTVFSVIRANTSGFLQSAGALELNNNVMTDSYNPSTSITNVLGATTRAVLTGGTQILATDNSRFLNLGSPIVSSRIPSNMRTHAKVYRNANYNYSVSQPLPNPNTDTTFPSVSIREGGENQLTMEGGFGNLGVQSFHILITRHPVVDVLGTQYIQGCDQTTIQGILASFSFTGRGSMTFNFTGGNETELSIGNNLPIIETPDLEEAGLTPFNFGLANLVTLNRF